MLQLSQDSLLKWPFVGLEVAAGYITWNHCFLENLFTASFVLDVCSTYCRIKTQNDWGISQKRSQIFRIMKEMRIVLICFACFLQSLLLFVHFFFLLGIYKVGAVCMCSLSQLVGYISFSITPGCWALVTLGMMVCSLKVFPDLVVHTGFSPLVFFFLSLRYGFFLCPAFLFRYSFVFSWF